MKGKTVLIVEDESMLSEAYKTILQKEHFKALTAFNGREALEVLENNSVDLILLDLRMPKMGGLEFLKTYDHRHKKLPKTIVFSNYDVQSDIDEAFKYGADRYMLKAWASPKELVRVVKDTISSEV